MKKNLNPIFTLTLWGLCMTMFGAAAVSCESEKEVDGANYVIFLDDVHGEHIAVNETLVITPSFNNPKAAELEYRWLSLNLNTATVETNDDGTGTVTGIIPGTAEIKIVCTTNPKLSAICTVEIFSRSITLDKGAGGEVENVFKGATLVITPTFDGDGTAAKSFTWTSSAPEIASVAKGANNAASVTGVTPGTATITITCDTDPTLTASCKVEVKAYTIALVPNGGVVAKNATLNITPTYNDSGAAALGYTWTSDNPAVASVTGNIDGTATVRGVEIGEAVITVTCDTDPTLTASCNVTVEGVPFVFDKIFIDGSAVSAGKTEIVATLENAGIYAWYGELAAGDLIIPTEQGANTHYVAPKDGSATFASSTGAAVEAAELSIDASIWTIPEAGKYRVVINKAAKTMAVYSPAIDLQTKIVSWTYGTDNANTIDMPVTDLCNIGDAWGWSYNDTDRGYVQSAADPQILVWDQSGTAGYGSAQWGNQRIKFVVWNNPAIGNGGNVYTITCPKTSTEVPKPNVNIKLKETYPLGEGFDSDTKESYYNFSANVFVNFIIVDLRNMTMYADYR